MPWENIEERLGKAFCVSAAYHGGNVAFPRGQMDIDEWLTSIAETDEELRELNVPRIQFLQNRWRFEKLAQFDWENHSSDTHRSVWAMHVGSRVFVLYSGGYKYWVVAAIEAAEAEDKPALLRAVIQHLLKESSLVPLPPTHLSHVRPDLKIDENEITRHRPEPVVTHPGGYLSKLLVGWIGPWIERPVLGYWHHDDPK